MRDGPVRDRIWRSAPQHTTTSLLLARLGKDPDSEYLDVCGTKLSAAEVADRPPTGWRTRCADLGRAAGRPGRHADRELARGDARLVGRRRAGAVAVPVNTAYKGEYLRHQLADSGRAVLVVAADLADRAGAVVADSTGSTTSWSSAPRGRLLAGAPTHRWDDLLAADAAAAPVDVPAVATSPRSSTPAARPGLSKGCMLSHNYHEALARQIGICWGRTADDVVWTPLPLFHFNALVTAVLGAAGLRRPGGDLPAVLGVELLAGDEPHRRDHHLDARHHGLPAGPRRRPAGDAAVRRARGQHVAAADRRRAAARPRSTIVLRAASASTRSAAPTASPRRSLISWQPPGVREQAQRRGRDQRRVLRRAHLRRRRQRAAARHRRRDRDPARSGRT